MESLRENKPLLYSVCGSGLIIFSLAAGWLPDVAAQFEIIDFPPEVSQILLLVLTICFWFPSITSRFMILPLLPNALFMHLEVGISLFGRQI